MSKGENGKQQPNNNQINGTRKKIRKTRSRCFKMGNDLRLADEEGCVGNAGIDKTYTFEQVLTLTYRLL